jgi:hypothetical protein
VFTDSDLTNQVRATLAGFEAEYDVQAIVAEIQTAYGTVDIDAVEPDAYWVIIQNHGK